LVGCNQLIHIAANHPGKTAFFREALGDKFIRKDNPGVNEINQRTVLHATQRGSQEHQRMIIRRSD